MSAMTDAQEPATTSEEAPWGWKTDENGNQVPRNKPGRPRLDRDKRKPRKRSIGSGRITTLGKPSLGRCIEHLANETGLLPTTFARMLIVEALKARGWPMSRIDAEFGKLGDISESDLRRHDADADAGEGE